jgi:hypothetical protein
MKKILFIAVLLSALNLSAEMNFKFGGYIYEMPILQGLTDFDKEYGINNNNKSPYSNITRLRLTPELLVGKNGSLILHYEADVVHSKLGYLKNISDATDRQAIDMNWSIMNGKNVEINHYIDRLYYKQTFGWGEVTLGRQNLAFGVGKIWQPTDLFNPINPANFSKFEKDGSDAIAATVNLGNSSDLKVVYNAYDHGNKGNFAVKYGTNYKKFDYSAIVGYFDENPVIGADFTGNLLGIGFHGEGLYNYNDKITKSRYFRGILGVDYQFTDKLNGLIEYQYNGLGTNCACGYDALFLKVLKGEIQNIGIYYLAAQLSYKIHPMASISALNISNIGDGSGMTKLSLNYSASKNLNLIMGAAFFYGAERTEYAHYYSSAAYILAQWYF